MKYNSKDKGKSGVYVIRNTVENKVYVGAAKDIYWRINQHIQILSKATRDGNRYMIEAWCNYGRESFEYFVAEYLDNPTPELLKERELYWMKHFKSTDRKYGYNLRMDSKQGMILHPETSQRLKEKLKQRYINDPSLKQVIGEKSREFWKNNPEVKERMKQNVRKTRQEKYQFLQYDKNMNLICTWDSVEEILKANPTYKWQNIYAVCNGYKKTIYGYVWKKELKI